MRISADPASTSNSGNRLGRRRFSDHSQPWNDSELQGPSRFAQSAPRTAPEETFTRTSLQRYLKEIGKVPLLTRDEEAALAKRIKRGDAAARDRMILSNLRLVVKIAYDYKDFGLPILDLISEGNIGLMKAVERFDPEKGGKMSAYSSWWIKQSMKRAIANQSKTIRLPIHLVEKISRIRKTARQLAEELDREPTDDELSAVTEMPVNKIAHLKSVSARPTSLDAPVGFESDGAELGDFVGDDNAASPYERLNEKTLQDDLTQMIENLESRESLIIKMRFGIGRHSPRTLEEVGQVFGITRERVRQLQNLALSKMRRVFHRTERQRSAEEIDQEKRAEARIEVLKEYFEQLAAN